MTHPRRLEQATAVAAGVHGGVSIVVDPEPDGPRSALRTTLKAWSSIPDGATHQLLLQDDIVPSAGMWEQAKAAVRAEPGAALAMLAFWQSRNGGAVRLAALRGARWARPVNEYFPTPALILPADVARAFVGYARAAGDAWPEDQLMYRFLKSEAVPALL